MDITKSKIKTTVTITEIVPISFLFENIHKEDNFLQIEYSCKFGTQNENM